MEKILIKDGAGRVLYSTDKSPEFMSCAETCINGSEIYFCSSCKKKKRRGAVSSGENSIYLCTDDKDSIASNRHFKQIMNAYATAGHAIGAARSLALEESRNSFRRFIHNLVSLNAHIFQDIYELVSQDELALAKKGKQLDIISREIQRDVKKYARTMLQILKTNHSIKNEIGVFRRYFATDNFQVNKKKHPIHRVLLNSLHLFFEDFTDKRIWVNIESIDGTFLIDYEAIHVSLFHLFENAVKYAKPGEDIFISFPSRNPLHISIKMKSLKIEKDEADLLQTEGYRGRNTAVGEFVGGGIGLSTVKALLEMNGAKLHIIPGDDCEIIDGTPYSPNEFLIIFG